MTLAPLRPAALRPHPRLGLTSRRRLTISGTTLDPATDWTEALTLEDSLCRLTPPAAFPYPLPTEPVAEGAQAIRNLAERIDSNSPFELIETKTLTVAGHIIFTAIPQIYTDLELRYMGRGNAPGSGAMDDVYARFNDYAGAGYNSQRLLISAATVTASAVSSGGSAIFGRCPDSTGDANLRGHGRIILPDYRGGGYREWYGDSQAGAGAAGGARVLDSGVVWGLGAAIAITKLDLFPGFGVNFAVGSRAALYGVK